MIVVEEPALRLEIPQLQDQMYRDRHSARMDNISFGLAQIEVHLSVFVSEAGQPVQLVDFVLGKDRQAMGKLLIVCILHDGYSQKS